MIAALSKTGETDWGLIIAYLISGAALIAAAYIGLKGSRQTAKAMEHSARIARGQEDQKKVIDEINKSVNGVEPGAPVLRETAEETNRLVKLMLENQGTQDHRTERIETKVDHIDGRVDGLDRRVTDLEHKPERRSRKKAPGTE